MRGKIEEDGEGVKLPGSFKLNQDQDMDKLASLNVKFFKDVKSLQIIKD